MVLTGAGRGFCSGLDLTDPNPPEAGGGVEFPRSGMRWQERIAELTARLHRLRQPVIAAVNGPAYGGGFAHRAGLRHPHRRRIGTVLHAVHQAGPRRLRHRRQLYPAADRRRGSGVRPDPDRTRGRQPTRRCGSASYRGCPAVPRWSTTRWRWPKPLQLRQIRRGVDQAGDVGESRRAEPGGGAAPGEPQPDPGVDERRDARG